MVEANSAKTTSPRKKRSNTREGANKNNEKQQQQQQQQQDLLRQMEEYVALDQILEARKIVDLIVEDEQYNTALLSSEQRTTIQKIIVQSDHVRSLLVDMLADQTWTLAQRKRGITVHYRHEPPSPIHAVKTRFVFHNATPQDFIHLVSIFNESDLMPLWFPKHIVKSAELLAKPSNYNQVLHLKMSFGRMSPISPRDTVLDGNGYHLVDRNAVIIFAKSINESPYCDEIPEPTKGTVRMETRNAFLVQLLPNNKLVFCTISKDDLKFKYMPSWVLNYVSEGAVPFELILSIKRILENFKGSPWEDRVVSKRDFYGEIERRLGEELAAMEQQLMSGGGGVGVDVAANGGGDITNGVVSSAQHQEYEWMSNESEDMMNIEDDDDLQSQSLLIVMVVYVVSFILFFLAITWLSHNQYDIAVKNVNVITEFWMKVILSLVVTMITTLVLFFRPQRKHSSGATISTTTDQTKSLRDISRLETSLSSRNTATSSIKSNAVKRGLGTLSPSLADISMAREELQTPRISNQNKTNTKKKLTVKRILKKTVMLPIDLVRLPIRKAGKRGGVLAKNNKTPPISITTIQES